MRMFFNLKRIINTKLFNYSAREILNLPAVNCGNGGSVVVVSQLCSRDLIMYLVAIKSFTRFISPIKVIIVGDRLSVEDIATLNNNITNLEIINILDVDTDSFPKGGCWERLLTILDVCQDYFTIQLDADTITLSMPEEVIKCISENKSFTLGTDMGQNITSFREASRFLKDQNAANQHVQILAELSLEKIDEEDNLKYIRGCAAFAGFARKEASREQIKNIARSIELIIGENKWKEWGSEQVASNIAIANSDNPLVLPVTKYHYYKPGIDWGQFHFLHFVGSLRFSDGGYARLAKRQIEMLKTSAF